MNTTAYKIKLKKGDKVVVRSGKYKGVTGKVLLVHPRLNKVTVEGVNIVKRHVKATKTQTGGIKEITKPIWVSKVGLYNPTTKKASRLASHINSDGKKVRVYAGSKKEVTTHADK